MSTTIVPPILRNAGLNYTVVELQHVQAIHGYLHDALCGVIMYVVSSSRARIVVRCRVVCQCDATVHHRNNSANLNLLANSTARLGRRAGATSQDWYAIVLLLHCNYGARVGCSGQRVCDEDDGTRICHIHGAFELQLERTTTGAGGTYRMTHLPWECLRRHIEVCYDCVGNHGDLHRMSRIVPRSRLF